MVNDYCWKGYVRTFRNTDREEWLKKMVKNYHRVAIAGQTVPTPSMVDAWRNSFDVLQEAFASLSEDYNDLFLLFEYALPKYPPRDGAVKRKYIKVTDAVVLSKDTAAVLEFKREDEPYIAAIRQAKAYRRRIRNWHNASRGMNKCAIAVFTKGEGVYRKYQKALAVSPDTFAGALKEAFGDRPVRMLSADTSKWQRSDYSLK